MKAVVFKEYGGPEVLHFTEVEKPVPKDNEVLIKVCAASINSWDWELLRGVPFVNRLFFGLFRPKKINILGADIAGRIEAIGKNVSKFKPGDEVLGDFSHGYWGGFAEYVCTDENLLTFKPSNMTFEQAASIPQAAVLAMQGLIKGNIQRGTKVLINGAGGGTGSFAIQISKSYGAEITAVDSTEKLETMLSLGANHVIDYTKEDFTKNNQHYDLILDVMGYKHSIFDYRRALSKDGRYVMIGGATSLVNQLLLMGPFITLASKKRWGF